MAKFFAVFFILSCTAFTETFFHRLVWEKDPATTVTLGYLQKEGLQGTMYYDTVDHGQNVEAYRFKKAATKKTKFRGTDSQFVYLRDLKPDTRYYFVVKDGESISRRFYFWTAPNTKKEFRFIAGGDSRTHSKNRRKSNVLVPKIRPLFVLFTGDFTGASTVKQWRAWLTDWQLTHSDDGRMYPIVPIRGNHDKKGAVAAVFGLENPQEYYSLSFAGQSLALYCLNTEIDMGGQQRVWLLNAVKAEAKQHRYVLAAYHKPIRPHVRGKREGQAQYQYWAQLFYDYKFDLLIEGDSHCVKRTAAVKPSLEEGHDEGFVLAKEGYHKIGEGCWGAPLRNANDQKSWTLDAGRFNSFDIVDVRKDRLEIKTVNSDESSPLFSLKEGDALFSLPAGLHLWQAKSGETLKIPARQK